MRFLEIISGWVNRYFSDEEAIFLILLLLLTGLFLFMLGDSLAPVFTGLILAFLLTGMVDRLKAFRVPETLAVGVSFAFFLAAMLTVLLFMVPLLIRQTRALVGAVPDIMVQLRHGAQQLVDRFPDLVTEAQFSQWLESIGGQLGSWSTTVLELVVGQVPSLVGLLIYLVLVPISVFFMLKDRVALLRFALSLLPERRPLLNRVGAEMNVQLINYVRGKFIEILLVGATTFVGFSLLGLNYAALLGFLVGLSVLVPYIGAAVVTIPVALVGLLQFGWTWDFAWIMILYGVIQAIDGNILVPVLFSEAVDLHPLTIIVAVLAFGGLWGFWGVFFAIPLATLIKAIYNAWPREESVVMEARTPRREAAGR
ncbi:MAG: AI-2E family transporter [Pseudomonadota bacterium]